MAVSTVTQPQHRASERPVKGKSEFSEKSRRGWLRKRQAETPAAPVAERSTFPQPDAPTQVLPQVPTARADGALPPVLYRERPGDLDKAAHNITLAATSAALHRWSAIRLEEALAVHLRVLHGLAEQERTEGRKLLERHGNGARAAAQIVEDLGEIVTAEQKANELPGVSVKAHVDTDALGSELTAVIANQGALSDATAQFQRITPGMPDPRVQVSVTTVSVSQPASPVHVPGDGSHAPLPVVDEAADPGAGKPLPHRDPLPPVTVLPADIDGETPDPYRDVDPADEDLKPGAWIYDEGCGSTGPVWLLLRRKTPLIGEQGPATVLEFANGMKPEFKPGSHVKMLDVRRAQVLLAEHEHKLAERAAQKAGSGR